MVFNSFVTRSVPLHGRNNNALPYSFAGWGMSVMPAGTRSRDVFLPLPCVRLADIFEADAAVAPFHAGRIMEQMSGAEVLDAVGLGATLLAFDGGLV
jgi:hypothetical protein